MITDSTITALHARRVWDSRGNPTVEVEVATAGGAVGRAIAPAGASRGTREAVDLRDGGTRLGGMDVRGAVANVTEAIAPRLIGMDSTAQDMVDAAMLALDPSPHKARLGGNAMVATSLAVLQAAAAARRVPLWQHLAETWGEVPTLPLPEIQIFGGGAHAGRRVDVQDFMVMVPGATSFAEALEVTAEIYRAAGARMRARGRLAGVADEGGWWPDFASNEEALETLVAAIADTGKGRVSGSSSRLMSQRRNSGVTGDIVWRWMAGTSTAASCQTCWAAGSPPIPSSRSKTRLPRMTPRE